MSLVVSLVGTLPVTGGTTGAPLTGGFGLIGAHFVGAFGTAVLEGEALTLGVVPGLTVAVLLDPPVKTVKVRISSTVMTIAVPATGPAIVLRRLARARRSCSA